MLRALCRGCGSCVCGLSCRAAFVLKAVAGTAQEPAAARALEAQGAQGNATGLAAEDVLLALPLQEAGRIEERLDRACNQGHARTLSSLLQDGLSRWIRALGRNNVLCVKLDDVIRYDAASSCLRAPMPAMCNAQRPCTGVARPERAGQCRLFPIMSLPRTPLLYGNYSTACLVLTIDSPLPSPPHTLHLFLSVCDRDAEGTYTHILEWLGQPDAKAAVKRFLAVQKINRDTTPRAAPGSVAERELNEQLARLRSEVFAGRAERLDQICAGLGGTGR